LILQEKYMPTIHFTTPIGETRSVDAPIGQNLMQVATSHGLQGIIGECGGAAMCATCHVYVDDAWLGKLNPANANELEMLDCTNSERKVGSRLSCQIKITQELDGLVVTLPEVQ
jgi:2Fe-2S ferredoxin